MTVNRVLEAALATTSRATGSSASLMLSHRGEGIKQLAEVARIEDRNHFEALTPRIYELGGKLPDDMKVFHDMSACPPARLPKDPTDIKAMLTVLVNAERCAVAGYSQARMIFLMCGS